MSGVAFVFEKVSGTWTQKAALTASWSSINDQFGASVAVNADSAKTDRGAVYVYVMSGSNWASAMETIKFTRASAADADCLGTTVAISPDGGVIAARLPPFESVVEDRKTSPPDQGIEAISPKSLARVSSSGTFFS